MTFGYNAELNDSITDQEILSSMNVHNSVSFIENAIDVKDWDTF